MQEVKAWPCHISQPLGAGRAPLLAHQDSVNRGDLRIASDPDLTTHGLQRFARDFENGGRKIPCDPVVACGVL